MRAGEPISGASRAAHRPVAGRSRPAPALRADARRVRGALASAVAAAVGAWLAGTVWAEGATKLLDCGITRVCDAAGSCEPASGRVMFRMDPTELTGEGAGSYVLRYGDVETEMAASSELGPFLWTVGTARHALIVSSETEWLWHELALDATPKATVRFLSCAFEQ